MRIKEKSPEVYLADEPIVKVGPGEIAFLKEKALVAPRGRVRLCAHASSSDLLHEMIIVLNRSTYIHPHKHLSKSESFHIIEGHVEVVMFHDDGSISEIIDLGAPGSGRNFFYRLATPIFHTLIIHSDYLIIHETTNGPFQKGDAIFAPWAPEETNGAAAKKYMDDLAKTVATFPK